MSTTIPNGPPLLPDDIEAAEQLLQLGREAEAAGWTVERADHDGIRLTLLVNERVSAQITVRRMTIEEGRHTESFELSMLGIDRVEGVAVAVQAARQVLAQISAR